MKQAERRQHTTKLMIEAAKALIHEKGCETITMKDMMDKTGLSKGAMFHYVKSKDEIFVWVLLDRLEETHERFMREIEEGRHSFDEPMEQIAQSILAYERAEDVSNKVLLYLLGKESQPVIADALKQYYERAVERSQLWIELGKKAGVISQSVDAARTAELLVLLTLGLRTRSSIPDVSASFKAQDLIKLIYDILKSDQ